MDKDFKEALNDIVGNFCYEQHKEARRCCEGCAETFSRNTHILSRYGAQLVNLGYDLAVKRLVYGVDAPNGATAYGTWLETQR